MFIKLKYNFLLLYVAKVRQQYAKQSDGKRRHNVSLLHNAFDISTQVRSTVPKTAPIECDY